MAETREPVRLQKWLAEAGLCSRREGERWILAGRLNINGKKTTTLGVRVGPEDRVTLDGKPVQKPVSPRLVLALHKPRGLICSRKDSEGRPTIFDLFTEAEAKKLPRLFSVGRLDYHSEGLLLLTNHGALTHRLTHPGSQIPRTYRIKVHGRISESTLSQLKQGVSLADGPTGPLDITLDRVAGINSWLTITVREGRNRLIRRIFETLNMPVARLIRVAYSGVELGMLPRRAWRTVSGVELRFLKKTVEID